MDPAGVALAGIQELSKQYDTLREMIVQQQEQIEQQQILIGKLLNEKH